MTPTSTHDQTVRKGGSVVKGCVLLCVGVYGYGQVKLWCLCGWSLRVGGG